MDRMPGSLFVCLIAGWLATAGCVGPDGEPNSTTDPSNAESPSGKADYFGEDDRKDPYAQGVTDREREWARATSAMITEGDLSPNDDGEGLTLQTETFRSNRNMCEDTPFADQPVAPDCSAFLVAPDVMVTAGHCIDHTEFDCDRGRFLFDYGLYTEGEDPTAVASEDVYECKEIVAKNFEGWRPAKQDYAVVRLERPVEDRAPLQIRERGTAQTGDHLVTIGHPAGLPVKIDAEGVVLTTRDYDLVGTADVFGGNSGGPMINLQTGKVEGISKADGTPRYTYDSEDGCRRPKQCREVNPEADQDGAGECMGARAYMTEHWREFVAQATSGDGDGGGDTGLGPDAGSGGDAGPSSGSDAGYSDADAGPFGDTR